jgi:uncharacterized damage-inducible protein DinB
MDALAAHHADMTMTLSDALLEVAQEAPATGRLLDRLPADRLAWRPHARSMTLGQLALHVASIPRAVAQAIAAGQVDVADLVAHPECEAIDQVRDAWAATLAFLDSQPEPPLAADGTWAVMRGGAPLVALPMAAARRTFMLNHWYHHRGQLTVYLRLLDVPLPSVYGPSADEDPFG